MGFSLFWVHWGPEHENVSHSVESDSATEWTVAHQASMSMEFSRQEYWSW